MLFNHTLNTLTKPPRQKQELALLLTLNHKGFDLYGTIISSSASILWSRKHMEKKANAYAFFITFKFLNKMCKSISYKKGKEMRNFLHWLMLLPFIYLLFRYWLTELFMSASPTKINKLERTTDPQQNTDSYSSLYKWPLSKERTSSTYLFINEPHFPEWHEKSYHSTVARTGHNLILGVYHFLHPGLFKFCVQMHEQATHPWTRTVYTSS